MRPAAAADFLFGPPGAFEEVDGEPVLQSTPEHGSMTAQQLEDLAAAQHQRLDEAEEEQREEVVYEARPLKTRKRQRKELGKPGKRSTCFLCAYIGERDTMLPSDDVTKIVEMLRLNTGRMDPAVLANQIAEFYAKLRARVNHQLQPGEVPLPHMNAATVLEHIRSHHQDPEVKIVTMLESLQELRETLMDTVLEQNKKTKHIRGNLSQISALERVIKLELLVQGKDPSKMFGFSGGARVAPQAHKQGAVNHNTKTLYDLWRQ